MNKSLFHHAVDSDEARAALMEAERQAELPARLMDLDAMTITQEPERYRDDDHRSWRTVFERRMEQLETDGSQSFLDGMKRLRIAPERVPILREINPHLEPKTGWRSVAVPGYIPPRSFFAFLAARRFPTTISVRPPDRLDYLPEPDIIHDVFGHVPLHADPDFAEFLQLYGETALAAPRDAAEALARLFWFTVEFGLVQEAGRTKLYGAGLLSSPGEGRHALASSKVDRRRFDLDEVIATPFEIDHFQPILFVLEGFDQLRDAMRTLAGRLRLSSEDAAE